MMRVAVFGPSGMLGRQVVKALGPDAVPVYRSVCELSNKRSVNAAVDGCDAVINCAGIVPTKATSTAEMILVNGTFPWILSECEIPTVLVSTDCVFSGRSRGKYQTSDIPDSDDCYGRSKSIGEVMAPHVAVVRTSFIGCDHGFMNWILQTGTTARSLELRQHVPGWKNALWTGSTVQTVALELARLVKQEPMPVGILHMATDKSINKYDLALKLVEMYKLNIHVEPAYHPVMNRALVPSIVLPDIDTALTEYQCVAR